MKNRQSVGMVIGMHMRTVKRAVIELVFLAAGSLVVHYGIAPYLLSVGIMPHELVAAHLSVAQTFATIVSLRVIAWLIIR